MSHSNTILTQIHIILSKMTSRSYKISKFYLIFFPKLEDHFEEQSKSKNTEIVHQLSSVLLDCCNWGRKVSVQSRRVLGQCKQVLELDMKVLVQNM